MKAVLLSLFLGFFAVEGLVIHLAKVSVASDDIPNVTPNDPRCVADGIFRNPHDCQAYYVCRNGVSQDRKCPEGMKFHPLKRCTLDTVSCDDQDSPSISEDFKCPEDYGQFPYPPDCHKYVSCFENDPTINTCPENQMYQDNVGCVEGVCSRVVRSSPQTDDDDDRCFAPEDVGPCKAQITRYYYDINVGQCKTFTYGGCEGNRNNYETKHECELACVHKAIERAVSSICQTHSQVIPDELNCKRYTECLNYHPHVITCSENEGFSRSRRACVPVSSSDCKNNNVLDILQD